jgi:ankyrin repeat protein
MDAQLEAALDANKLSALTKALASKPDLTALDKDGNAALHRVMRLKKMDLAEALLAAGSPIDVPNDDGNSPLYVLLKSKSGVMSDTEKTNARWLMDRGARLDFVGDYQQTALHFAAANSDVAFVSELVERGAKVTRDKGGSTPLFGCFSVHDKKENPLWPYLLDHGCAITDVDGRGRTLLHEAVTCHSVAGVKFLLGRDVDQTAKDGDGRTALECAKEYGNAKIAALLGG